MFHDQKTPDTPVGAHAPIDDIEQRRNHRKLQALPTLMTRLAAASAAPSTPPKAAPEVTP